MLIIVRTILIQLALGFRSRVTLQAENAVLHHQVEILRRRAPRRVHVTRTDRLFFKLILRLWPKAAGLIRIVHPKTLVRWHREGFRLYWRWRSRKRGGRPKIPKEIRVLVRQMSTENPLWGAPRIHGELLKLGFDISQATVSRHMPKRRPNPDQTWKTFLLNHLHCTSSIDFLIVPTLTFRILYIRAPDPQHLKAMISDTTALVSIVGVNNENGAIADLSAISDICKSDGVLFHADLAQAPLSMDLDLLDLDIAFATISAHKLYGPKGVGALLTGPGASEIVKPVVSGAGQQGGRRGGTMPTELIMGFGEACRLVGENGQIERESLAANRNDFVRSLEEKQFATLVGSLENRHPGNALMRFPGRDASDLLARLQPLIAASTQSACSSGSVEPSHVLRAMGFDHQMASECIRFSFGRFSTEQQVSAAIGVLSTALELA